LNKQEDQEFTNFLRGKAAEAKRDLGFSATAFLGMLAAEGGYATAKKLLSRKVPSDGFADLWRHGRLDLTVEALVVETKWRAYFDALLISRAESLLRKSNYAFNPFELDKVNRVQDAAERTLPGNSATTLKTSRTVSSDAPPHRASRRYWWVNQNQTYKHEVPGGFLWSPKTRSDGVRNQFYDNMTEVNVGDVIFSFCDTRIKAIGVAIGKAETSTKPDFGNAGASWSKEGWLVPVEFKELDSQIRPKEHIESLRAHLPDKYSPLQDSGDGLQSVYLAAVSTSMAQVLATLIGQEFGSTVAALNGELDQLESVADRQEEAIRGRTDIGPTTKAQLVNARRGQGVFKANVRLNEKACRITGVTDPLHLRASHIKPWKDSSDEEKLNGCNGLLLAPHIDHLFDRGLISFSADGMLLISGQLDQTVLASWGIPVPKFVGAFNVDQIKFLRYHEEFIFKR